MEKVRTWCGHPSDRGRLKIRISCNNFDRMQALQDEYCKLNENYFGLPVSQNVVFDTELVSKVIADLPLSCLSYCQSCLMSYSSVRMSQSVLSTVILYQCLKLKTRNKAMTCNDFRAIAISPILCKVFEYCLLDKFSNMLKTSDTQFGFKKGLSCNHAIYSVRR